MTWNTVWQYQADCVDLLAAASDDAREEVARCAAGHLPRAVSHLISRGHAARGLAQLCSMVVLNAHQ